MASSRSTEASPVYRDGNLQLIFSITLMAVLGVSSVTPAFPRMVRELDLSQQQVGLLVTAFTLPGVLLNLPLGVLADRIGRKKVLVPSLLLFGAAGAACALARSFEWLLALRFLQGIGGAPLGALNVTIIGDLFEGPRRTAALGYNVTVLSVGTASYPALGGALAVVAWYWPFALPLLALPVGLLVLARLHNPEPDGERQPLKDYADGVWHALRHWEVLGLLLVGVMIFLFLFGTYLTYLPSLLEERFGTGSFLIGLILSCASWATALASSKLSWFTRHVDVRLLVRLSFLIDAAMLALMPLVPLIWLMPVAAFVFGLAQGISIPAIQSLLTEKAPMRYRAAFLSVNGTIFRLGQTLGPLLMGIVITVGGTDLVFYTGAGLALCTFFVALFLIR